MIDNLTYSEEFFINVFRFFRFLQTGKGYIGSEFSLGGREENWVSFYSHQKKKKITIVELTNGYLDFYVETKSWIGWSKKKLSDYYGKDIRVQSIKRLAEMIKKNETLMKELV